MKTLTLILALALCLNAYSANKDIQYYASRVIDNSYISKDNECTNNELMIIRAYVAFQERDYNSCVFYCRKVSRIEQKSIIGIDLQSLKIILEVCSYTELNSWYDLISALNSSKHIEPGAFQFIKSYLQQNANIIANKSLLSYHLKQFGIVI